MTKSTITRERLEALANAEYCKSNPGAWLLGLKEVNELASMALAAMDSEPVFTLEVSQADYKGQKLGNHFGFITLDAARNLKEGNYQLYRHAQPALVVEREPIAWLNDAYLARGVVDGEAGNEDAGPGYIPVYREAGPQPAPVVPEEMPCGGAADDYHDGYQDGWNACRAAMLQAGALTNEGTKQAWTGIPDIDNAINMLDRIDTLDSCDDDRIEAVKTVLRRLAGNSPVIPDGYVMVPKEPTDEMLAAAKEWTGLTSTAEVVYIKMLAAAPQEVKGE